MSFFSSVLFFTLTCFLGAPAFAQQTKFNMTTSVVCTDAFNGGTNCNQMVLHLTSQCSQNTTVWYQFKICNPNSFAIEINGTSSKMKSEYFNYGFNSTTINPGGACLTYNRKGVLRDCDRNSTATLSVNAKGPNNSRGYSFTSLTVEPKLITDAPAQKGSSSPTKFRQTRMPTSPTHKPTKFVSKKPTSVRKPTRKPTAFVKSRRPSLIQKPTRKPSNRKPTRKPTREPTRKPSRKPTSRPTTTLISLNIVVKTDNFGKETWFEVKDKNNYNAVVLYSYDSLANNTLYSFSAQVNRFHCYRVFMYDDACDGMCYFFGAGYYEIWWGGKLVRASSFEGGCVEGTNVGNC